MFGGQKTTRNDAPVVDVPGVQLRFNAADQLQAPTRHRALDHFGFDVKDHAAFVKRLEGMGIKLDQPVGKDRRVTRSPTSPIPGEHSSRLQRLPRRRSGDANGLRELSEAAGEAM